VTSAEAYPACLAREYDSPRVTCECSSSSTLRDVLIMKRRCRGSMLAEILPRRNKEGSVRAK
jgi:hypothetical protein